MFIILDRKEATFEALAESLNLASRTGKQESICFSDLKKAMDFIEHRDLGNCSFLIHGSIGTSKNYQKNEIAPELERAVEVIHDRNPRSRVIVYTRASNLQDDMFMRHKVDGCIRDIVDLEVAQALHARGSVTDQELRNRGVSIERITRQSALEGKVQRISAVEFPMRPYYGSGSKEGD